MELALRQYMGLWRSLIIYNANPLAARRLRQVYSQFLQPGDLYLDAGAHVGNRVRAALSLGARVVALEPNPILLDYLRRRFSREEEVVLLPDAVADRAGTAEFYVSERFPTVSTASKPWIETVAGDPSFSAVQWDAKYQISTTTLDALIEQFGRPQFCKLDVEGYELQALNGLSTAIAAVSFEYVPAARELALRCLGRVQSLGDYEFNWAVAEQFRLQSGRWLDAQEMALELERMDLRSKSGDIYARLRHSHHRAPTMGRPGC